MVNTIQYMFEYYICIVPLQGLCQLIEPTVTIRCRQEDKAIVEGALQPALSSVRDKIKTNVEMKIDSDNFLSPKWWGWMKMKPWSHVQHVLLDYISRLESWHLSLFQCWRDRDVRTQGQDQGWQHSRGAAPDDRRKHDASDQDVALRSQRK